MRIWLHAVSVGEVKSLSTILSFLPSGEKLVTTITKTGLAEAKRSIKADSYRRLPWFTFSLVKKFRPDLFLMSETDFWPLLLSLLKKRGCKTAVVSGKLSNRSYSRLKRLRLAKLLYKNIDYFLLQSEEDKRRFSALGIPQEKLYVTGNLKLSLMPRLTDPETFRKSLNLKEEPVITIGSTHSNEEKLILDALADYEVTILVVPRHPERFNEVRKLLTNYPNAILIDKMGILSYCYQISSLAIVGGSFVPIGGHDVLEPIKCGAPTLFGPHMHTQKELMEIALKTGCARQTNLDSLLNDVKNPPKCAAPIFPDIAKITWLQLNTLFGIV